MSQKVTLRFADHVLTFTLTEAGVSEVERHFRRKWLYEFTRADGDYIVNFDHVLWMKVSPGDDVETDEAEERISALKTAQKEAHALFGIPTPSYP